MKTHKPLVHNSHLFNTSKSLLLLQSSYTTTPEERQQALALKEEAERAGIVCHLFILDKREEEEDGSRHIDKNKSAQKKVMHPEKLQMARC